MAVVAECYCPVPSLFKTCTEKVIQNLPQHEDHLVTAPPPIKHACLRLMSKRGTITDRNIEKLVYDRLVVLDLSASQVTDACLFKLSRCRNLRKVDLNSARESNQGITSAGLISLSRSCPFLQVLYLRRCVNVTDEGVIAVSENCPIIVELNCGGCSQLTDASLEALGQNSKHLKSVNFSNAGVTDSGVFSLVSGKCSASLKEIHMNNCASLTDEAVEAVVQYCPQISILLFHGCPKTTENARAALEELMAGGQCRMKQVTWTVYV
ncbi:hypothetical protein BaRGS_00013895 [Batillaria attramentaria]|uniref:Protein AMN1 homolog n=1 Tax=Batillaria attramentaria TaxID=370345 RepID=A0ABD0L5P6_9CAEN